MSLREWKQGTTFVPGSPGVGRPSLGAPRWVCVYRSPAYVRLEGWRARWDPVLFSHIPSSSGFPSWFRKPFYSIPQNSELLLPGDLQGSSSGPQQRRVGEHSWGADRPGLTCHTFGSSAHLWGEPLFLTPGRLLASNAFEKRQKMTPGLTFKP